VVPHAHPEEQFSAPEAALLHQKMGLVLKRAGDGLSMADERTIGYPDDVLC